MKYTVVEAKNLQSLIDRVSIMLKDSWSPLGNVTVLEPYHRQYVNYYQAVVLYDHFAGLVICPEEQKENE